jgi:hypothetical protein
MGQLRADVVEHQALDAAAQGAGRRHAVPMAPPIEVPSQCKRSTPSWSSSDTASCS